MEKIKNHRSRKAETGKAADSRRSGAGGSKHINITLGKKQLFTIIGIIVVIILAAILVPVYKNYIEPFNQVIIKVDDSEINMRFFLDRIRISGSNPTSMLYTLTQELLISKEAPQYGITVTEDDIDEYLKLMAGGGAESISDVEYKEWLKQYSNTNQISEKQLREIIEANLLYSRFEKYLAEYLPRTREQVYLNIIVIADYDEAKAASDRIKSGEAFADVARELSIDESTGENGGVLGWVVPELSILEGYITRLSVNQVSSPIPYYSSTGTITTDDTSELPSAYYIIMISDVDSNREADDYAYEQLQANAMEDWFNAEVGQHEIAYNYNSETIAFINWQLEKDR